MVLSSSMMGQVDLWNVPFYSVSFLLHHYLSSPHREDFLTGEQFSIKEVWLLFFPAIQHLPGLYCLVPGALLILRSIPMDLSIFYRWPYFCWFYLMITSFPETYHWTLINSQSSLLNAYIPREIVTFFILSANTITDIYLEAKASSRSRQNLHIKHL